MGMQRAQFLLPEGDRFTNSGTVYGEIDLFSKLHCHAHAAFPEVICGKLEKFYNRMLGLPAVKKVISGESQFGPSRSSCSLSRGEVFWKGPYALRGHYPSSSFNR